MTTCSEVEQQIKALSGAVRSLAAHVSKIDNAQQEIIKLKKGQKSNENWIKKVNKLASENTTEVAAVMAGMTAVKTDVANLLGTTGALKTKTQTITNSLSSIRNKATSAFDLAGEAKKTSRKTRFDLADTNKKLKSTNKTALKGLKVGNAAKFDAAKALGFGRQAKEGVVRAESKITATNGRLRRNIRTTAKNTSKIKGVSKTAISALKRGKRAAQSAAKNASKIKSVGKTALKGLKGATKALGGLASAWLQIAALAGLAALIAANRRGISKTKDDVSDIGKLARGNRKDVKSLYKLSGRNTKDIKANYYDIRKLEKFKTWAQKWIQDLSQKFKSLKTQISKLTSKVTNLSKLVNSIKSQLTKISTKISKIGNKVSSNSKAIKNIRSSVNNVNKRLSKLINNISRALKKISSNSNSINRNSKNIKKLKRMMQRLGNNITTIIKKKGGQMKCRFNDIAARANGRKLNAMMDAANTGMNARILNRVNGLHQKVGSQIPNGGLGGFMQRWMSRWDKFANFMKLPQILNAMTLMAVIHNAGMLSTNLIQTLGDALSMGLSLFPWGRDENDNPIDINGILGKEADQFMASLLGQEMWQATKFNWKKANSIYNSGMNVINTVRNMADSTREITEWGLEQNSKLMNAVKRDGVVHPNSYPWQPENINGATIMPQRMQRIIDGIENLDEAGSSLMMVTSEAKSIQDEAKELSDGIERFKKSLKEKPPKIEEIENEPIASAEAEDEAANSTPDMSNFDFDNV